MDSLVAVTEIYVMVSAGLNSIYMKHSGHLYIEELSGP
jgi:hypothetical protein